MLSNKGGRQPYTNETIIPGEVGACFLWSIRIAMESRIPGIQVGKHIHTSYVSCLIQSPLIEPQSIWCWSVAVFVPFHLHSSYEPRGLVHNRYARVKTVE